MQPDEDGRSALRRRLQRHYRWMDMAFWGAVVFFIAAGLGPFVIFYRTFQDDMALYALCITLPVALAAGLFAGVMRWWIKPNVDRMSALLETASPQRLMLEGSGGDGSFFRERAVLHHPDDAAAAGPWGPIWIKTPTDGRFFGKGERVPVTVYENPEETDGFVMIDTGRMLLWGERMPPDD